jgi:hypothetical protein
MNAIYLDGEKISINKEDIQNQCWGKPSKVQSQIWRKYGYVPTPNGLLYLPWRLV